MKKFWMAAAVAVLTACGGGGGGGDWAPLGSGAMEAKPDVPVTTAPGTDSVSGGSAGTDAAPGGDVGAGQGTDVGSGSGSTPDPEPGSGPSNPAESYTLRYQALEPATPMVDQLNAQGALGWRFAGDLDYQNGSPTTETKNRVFVNDSRSTFAYEIPVTARNLDAFQEQLNSLGARGFRFTGGYVIDNNAFHSIHRKQNGSGAAFEYRLVPLADGSMSSQLPPGKTLLAAARKWGAEGYRMGGSHGVFSEAGEARSAWIYWKQLQSPSVFDYEMLPPAKSEAELLAQLAAQGARGFRFMSTFLGVAESGMTLEDYNLYEKDISQSASFSYLMFPAQDGIDAALAQANAQGARGMAWIGDYWFSDGAKSIFVKASNCTGTICELGTIFDL